MAININHVKNTFCGNSGIFVFGTGIVPDNIDTVYSKNFCGKYYGDGSALTGLPTGSFITAPVGGNYLVTGAKGLLDDSWSFLLNPVVGFVNSGCFNVVFNTTFSSICEGANNNFISPSNWSKICSGADRSAIIGGAFNTINADVSRSVILGGSSITASSNDTAYGKNFCAFDGKYYGDGSALTGLATGNFITTSQTGVFGAAGYVTTGSTGIFITTGQTGAFGAAGYVSTGATGIFITTGMTGAFGGGTNVNLSGYITTGNLKYLNLDGQACGFILGTDFQSSGSYTFAFNAFNSYSTYTSSNNFLISTESSSVNSGAKNNGILGGCYNNINDNVCASVILGGQYITGTSNKTAYANNFCAYQGKYYGDGSSLTGLATGDFITVNQTGNFVTRSLTGNFVTTNLTGDFITYHDTGSLVSISQTGNFVTKQNTGIFITSGQTGDFLNKNITGDLSKTVLACLYLDTGYFLTSGDSFSCSFAARQITTNSNETYLQRNGSICLFEMEAGDHITFTASINAVGCATNSYAYFKLEGSARRCMFLDDLLTNTCSKLNNSVVKQTFATSYTGYSASVEIDNNTNSLQIKVCGDDVDRQNWFAKVDVLKNNYIVNSQIVLPETLYFSGNASNYDWFNLRNWYSNSSLTSRSLSFAQTGNKVVVCGNKGPLINLNCNYWNTPQLINALNLTDQFGVCFYSSPSQPVGFSGTVSGVASFYGGSYLI